MKKNVLNDVWTRVDKGEADECWLWKGSTFSGRYGRFFLEGKAVLAHRAVYFAANGFIDDSKVILHKCNTTLCCNPAHLMLGTTSENSRHAITSKSFRPGSSGVHGVVRDKQRGYWTAHAYRSGKHINLYTGPSKEKAISARQKWEKSYGISFTKDQ